MQRSERPSQVMWSIGASEASSPASPYAADRKKPCYANLGLQRPGCDVPSSEVINGSGPSQGARGVRPGWSTDIILEYDRLHDELYSHSYSRCSLRLSTAAAAHP